VAELDRFLFSLACPPLAEDVCGEALEVGEALAVGEGVWDFLGGGWLGWKSDECQNIVENITHLLMKKSHHLPHSHSVMIMMPPLH
jgi:hypothetical protein